MEQFSPGDIAVMVLKFLASSNCINTVTAYMEEMPFLKFYIPPQTPGKCGKDFLKALARPSLTPSLSDLLGDYLQAKLNVTQIIEKENPERSPMRQYESLVTQIKVLTSILEKKNDNLDNRRSPPTEVGVVVHRRDAAVNTDVMDISCSQTLHSDVAALPVSSINVAPENDERSRLSCDENGDSQDSLDVPLLFYNTLISDSKIPEKLASTINEHLVGSQSSNEVLQKVCSKAESEIDKFMTELLQEDGEASQSSIVSQERPGNHAILPEDGLSTMFNDASNIIANDKNSLADSNNLGTPDSPINVEEPSVTTLLGKESTKKAPVKRITPTPVIVDPPKTNPVFETRETLQSCVLSPTKPAFPFSVKTSQQRKTWDSLGRRSITPKTPYVPSSSQKVPAGSTNKRKAGTTPVKLTPDKANNTEYNFMLVCPDSSTQNKRDIVTPMANSSENKECHSEQTPIDNPEQRFTADVTPMLEDVGDMGLLESKKRSPRLLRLVESAQKIRTTTTQSTLTRKSFSTPRKKKKYVRSLMFNTPPRIGENNGLRAIDSFADSPSQFLQENAFGVKLSLPAKRKELFVQEDVSPKIPKLSKEGMIKKVSTEVESDYKSSAFPDRRFRKSVDEITGDSEVTLSTSTIQQQTEKKRTNDKPSPQTFQPNLSSIAEGTNEELSVTDASFIDPDISTHNSSATNVSVQFEEHGMGDPVSSSQLPPVQMELEVTTEKPNSKSKNVAAKRSEKVNLGDSCMDHKEKKSSVPKSHGRKMKDLFGSELSSSSSEQEEGEIFSPPTSPRTPRSKRNILSTTNKDKPKENLASYDNDAYRRSKRLSGTKNKPQAKDNMETSTGTQQTKTVIQDRRSHARQSDEHRSRDKIINNSNNHQKVDSSNSEKERKGSSRRNSDKNKNPQPPEKSKSSPTELPNTRRSSRKPRKSDVNKAASKSIADAAVPLGRASKSPQTPPKKAHATGARLQLHSGTSVPKNLELGQLPSNLPSIPTTSSTKTDEASNENTNKHSQITFHILPAPLGFPDPTPVKKSVESRTEPKQFGIHTALITPVKPDESTSPPNLPLPPTPRYIVNELDGDSNSNSNMGLYRGVDGSFNRMILNEKTPSKPEITGPPPTPGRGIFGDESSMQGPAITTGNKISSKFLVNGSPRFLNVSDEQYTLQINSNIQPLTASSTKQNPTVKKKPLQDVQQDKPRSRLQSLLKRIQERT